MVCLCDGEGRHRGGGEVMLEFEVDCKTEIDIVITFLPISLHEGVLANMQSCYTKGMIHSLKVMKEVLNSKTKGGGKG